MPVIYACLATQLAVASEVVKKSFRWDELSGAVTGRKVSLVLPDGAHLLGVVREVRSDSLLLDVEKRTEKSQYKKGDNSVARELISTLQISETSGHWRALGTAIGGGAGAAAGAMAYKRFDNEGDSQTGAGLAAAAIGGGATAGFFSGKGLDKKTTVITVSDYRAAWNRPAASRAAQLAGD